MRSPRFFAVACRAPNGQIVVKSEAIEKTWIGRQKWLKLPFLRGSFALLDAMTLGNQALRFASDVQVNPQYQAPTDGAPVELASSPEPNAGADNKSDKIQDGAVVGAMVAGLAIGLFIFVYLPNLVADLVTGARNKGQETRGIGVNLLAGFLKLAFFLGYMVVLGRLETVREVFKYHGAEHKAINALERDLPVDTQTSLQQTRLHPRCGTSFAMIVLIVGLIVFTFIPRYPLTGMPGNPLKDASVRFLLELLILPVIAGISYELLRLAGKFRNQSIVNVFFKPGIWSQYLTTREPEAKHVEVAVAALKAVLEAEEKSA